MQFYKAYRNEKQIEMSNIQTLKIITLFVHMLEGLNVNVVFFNTLISTDVNITEKLKFNLSLCLYV